MTKDNEVEGALRFQARLDCRIETRFFIVRDWMFMLGLPEPVMQTYACVWSFTRVPLPTGAPDIARMLNKTERTIRMHFAHILSKGLWVVIPRYTVKGKYYLCAANRYVFLWNPSMPEALRGEPWLGGHVLHDAPDTHVPVASDTEVRETSGIESVSRTTGLLKRAEKNTKHASKSTTGPLVDLPAPLRAELERVMPGHVDSCIRVVNAHVRGGEPQSTKGAVLCALRMLIARVEAGGVENPPGLLRNNLLPEAEEFVAAGKFELAQLREEVERLDQALSSASTGFAVRTRLRKRERAFGDYSKKHVELLGVPPAEIGEAPEIDGELGAIVLEYSRQLAKHKRAQKSSDGLTANEALNAMDALDAKLDLLLKGAAE